MNPSFVADYSSRTGSSLVSALFRLASWGFRQFKRSPLRNAGIAFLSLAMLFSAANALYWQTGVHPAPLFGLGEGGVANQYTSQQETNVPVPAPLRPVSGTAPTQNPPQANAVSRAQPHPEAAQDGATTPVGNEDVAQVQRKLAALGLFEAKIDGYYGPVTADAIRDFERRVGLPARGALNPEIIARILGATNAAAQPLPPAQTAQTVQPMPPDPMPLDPVAHPASQPAPDALTSLVQSVAGRTTAPATPAAPVAVSASPGVDPVVDKALIEKIQRGLASLGFLYGTIDGIEGEATARAVRNFEVYQNFEVTGRISPELVDLLLAAGAII